MVRKLLLARALMTKPALVILDEPTSGLDVINSLEVREIIKRFAREGIAVLLSSHNMLEIEYPFRPGGPDRQGPHPRPGDVPGAEG